MWLFIQKDQRPMTAREVVFNKCSCNALAGLVIFESKFPNLLKIMLIFAKLSGPDFGSRCTEPKIDDIGAGLHYQNFPPRASTTYTNATFAWPVLCYKVQQHWSLSTMRLLRFLRFLIWQQNTSYIKWLGSSFVIMRNKSISRKIVQTEGLLPSPHILQGRGSVR